MLFEKGSITPELTESMLATVAPEMMEAVRNAQQAASVAPLPPGLEDILKGATETPETETPETPAEPAPETEQ